MTTRRVFIISVLLLAGCASAPPRLITPAGAALPELEPLYAAVGVRDALTIQVASNGCTTKADFSFYVERKGDAVTIAFARKRIDSCKSFAMGRTDLTFTWAELGVEPRAAVMLLNPLTAWTGPGS